MKSLSTVLLNEIYTIYNGRVGETLNLGQDPESGVAVVLEIVAVKRKEGGVLIKFADRRAAGPIYSEREFTFNKGV